MQRPTDVAYVALWLGLITGLLEAALRCFQRYALGELIWQGQSVFWMIPAAQAMVFAAASVPLALVAWRLRSEAVFSYAATLLSFFGWLNLLLLVPTLDLAAQGLLAAGLAAGTSRLFDRHRQWCMAAVRRSTRWLVLIVLLMAGALEAARKASEHQALAALPTAAPGARNVLLIVLDTVRADALGLYGARSSTSPWLDKFGRKGVVFDRALATAPWTLPSHASLFTGRLPHETSANWTAFLDDSWPTLAEWLAGQGYATAGFVANTRYCSRETGLARGFAHYQDYGHRWVDFALSTSLGRRILSSSHLARFGSCGWPGRKRAGDVSAGFLDWLDRRDRRRPFFAFLNYNDSHDPYDPPPPCGTSLPNNSAERSMLRHWWWIDKQKLSRDEVNLARQLYDDCIRYLDRQLRQLFHELAERGELDRTLVIITADHGEHFGEHGLFIHGNSLYQPVLHVPLVVFAPGLAPAGGRVTTAVSLRDVPATVAALLGQPAESPFPGRSLSRHWAAAGTAWAEDEPVISEIATPAKVPPDHGRSPVARGAMQSIVLGAYKYIRSGDGAEKFYDLDRDPREEQNLASESALGGRLQQMRHMLAESTHRP